MILTVTREFRFEAAHRLLGHVGRCRHIHGHSYLATVVLQGHRLNDLGMLADFGDIKRAIGSWIDSNWDHNIILGKNDPLLCIHEDEYRNVFDERDPFVMENNPTAENMAKYLAAMVDNTCKTKPGFDGLHLKSVTIRETESCSASVEYDAPTSANMENL